MSLSRLPSLPLKRAGVVATLGVVVAGTTPIAQAQTAVSGQVMPSVKSTTIMSPTDTQVLKGRLHGPRDGNLAQARGVTRPVAAAKPAAKNIPAASTATGRGDEANHRERNMLGAQVSGNNRFGGNTYQLPVDTLAVDFEDALVGFVSFDKLGTQREKKVYRANGTSTTTLYDARSGDISDIKTDTPVPTADITAGGVVVMPGTSLVQLMQKSSTAASHLPSSGAYAAPPTGQPVEINPLIPYSR